MIHRLLLLHEPELLFRHACEKHRAQYHKPDSREIGLADIFLQLIEPIHTHPSIRYDSLLPDLSDFAFILPQTLRLVHGFLRGSVHLLCFGLPYML